MHRATLLLTRKGLNSSHDDTINIDRSEDSMGMFKVTYKYEGSPNTRTFVACEMNVLQYVEDILTSLSYDVDPFHHIQVDTAIHPSVMYHHLDLEMSCVRDRILNQIENALRFEVTMNRV